MIHPVWLALAGVALAPIQKPASTGVFADRAGGQHAWSVTRSFGLLWGGSPYVPVGGRFTPRGLPANATEDDWRKDTEDLSALKARGLLDVLIVPDVSAASVSAVSWQRLVDLLEAQGFRYGISFGAGVGAELTGTIVNASGYRIADVRDGMDIGWDVPGADGGWYVIVDGRDGTLVYQEGRVRARDGQVSVSTSARVGDASVAILYPHRVLKPDNDSSLPDLWSGFDAYRDKLLLELGHVKFGPGLRFFLDPLGPRLGLAGEADYLVPDTPSFRLEWEAYLSRKYPNAEAVCAAWGITERDIKDFRAAAGLIPLWSGNKGIPYVLDPNDGKRYQVAGAESRFWSDLRTCRNEGVEYFMAAAADVLKREIANVPVVYTHTLPHRMFVNGAREGGFDGLGAAAYGRGTALTASGADSAFSQAGDSARTVWFLVTETSDPSGVEGRPGYPSRDAMHRDFDRLRSLGAAGIFVQSFRGADGLQLLDAPEQLGWLQEYASRLPTAASASAGAPRVLPFPAAASGYVQSGPIGSGAVWWVPSLAAGRALDYGTSYAGYVIKLPEGETHVIWSLLGPRETRLAVADPRKLQAFTPDGLPIEVRPDQKGKFARLIITETPCLIRAGGQEPFPIEAVEDSIAQLKTLVTQALAAKMPAQDYKYRLNTAEARFRHKDMASAYVMCSQALIGLVELVQPYSWREVEHAEVQTFTEVVTDPGASGGMHLALDTPANPPREGYALQLRFNAPADDQYDVWLACTPPGPATSTFAWMVDTGETHASAAGTVEGAPYLANRFAWTKLGRIALKPGAHTFTLRVTDRAAGTSEYRLAVDALLVTRMPFSPRGTVRPPAVPVR